VGFTWKCDESKAKQSKAKQSKAKQVWVSLGNAMNAKQSEAKWYGTGVLSTSK
jgi:hypothetical protein